MNITPVMVTKNERAINSNELSMRLLLNNLFIWHCILLMLMALAAAKLLRFSDYAGY
ncbi:hypothetical protein [Nitrosomonas sp. PLL12-2]|uniref:hypothetical protein n=1 Tax=Nitrosomonas sp. PLL12-2 TaxID=2980404 RepID=UPI0021CB1759|nr:hypothetical protein [Nitrosomonas sp. PLL12-2]